MSAAQKHTVNLNVKVEITLEPGMSLEDVVNDLDYSFTATTDGASVGDTEIESFDVTSVAQTEQGDRERQ